MNKQLLLRNKNFGIYFRIYENVALLLILIVREKIKNEEKKLIVITLLSLYFSIQVFKITLALI